MTPRPRRNYRVARTVAFDGADWLSEVIAIHRHGQPVGTVTMAGRTFAVALLAAITALLATSAHAMASTAPDLGTAASFAILAGTPKITNTGLSTISGNLGIAPAAAVVGFPPGTVTNGTIQVATTAVNTAKSNLTAAYGVAAASTCNFDKTGQNLGGLTLTPGTYCQTTAPTLTGPLTLSGDGVYIFQIGGTLVTAPGASVVLINGAQACNVYWQVSSSATIDTTTTFVGTIMALTDITVNTGADLTGRLLAQNGQVTLDDDHIALPTTCSPRPTPTATPTASATASVTTTASGSTPNSSSPPAVTTPHTPDTGAAATGPLRAAPSVLVALVVASVVSGLRFRRRRQVTADR